MFSGEADILYLMENQPGFDYDADAKVEVEVHGLGKGGKLDVIESFDEMGLREDLIRGIYAYGKNWVGQGITASRITTNS